MVVKAVSALKDANGSRLGAIVSYLQMEYKELQNQILASRFVRRISVQLKYATEKGKLVRCNRRYLIAGKGKNKLLESKAGGSKSVK
ncbi:hypothetical protein O6H91_11G030600 [Diphasiastrum complanatum]|uniref:Uncharacterized protein n=1 Tax=Diphasiastrum complanatum TaxID=34168 RepID=A0ACC2C807_DIPCM|nr:hypothetical protein O6H91_11G030600 [Diphasiastrum complanatum]